MDRQLSNQEQKCSSLENRAGCGLGLILFGGAVGALVGGYCFGEGTYKIGTAFVGLVAGEAFSTGISYVGSILDAMPENEIDENDCT